MRECPAQPGVPPAQRRHLEPKDIHVTRVLIAASRDWAGTARLPSVLAAAGISVDVVDVGSSGAAASSWVSNRIIEPGGSDVIAARVRAVASQYDRVIPCDEPITLALLRSTDPLGRAAIMTPADSLATLLDKASFPAAAEAASISVPAWAVATDLEQVASAAELLGPDVVVKARVGYAGLGVRFASDARQAVRAAKRLGLPVLVESRVFGDLGLMPCLYDRGRLLGAIAAEKAVTISERGFSTVAQMWPVDDELRAIAEKAGEAFGIDGFASVDLFREHSSGAIKVLEINPRPVPLVYAGVRFGVDFGALYASALAVRVESAPRLGRGTARIPLFPQELQRQRRSRGRVVGTLAWAATPGALREVPWGDRGLLRHYLGRAR